MNVVAENITKRFTTKGTAAVAQASFEAPSGGITTLLGPSGSGKTTLLRIVSGLETADEGRVLVGGEDITHVPVGKRGFGFVFQTFALFNQLTVRENVGFGLEARGVKKGDVKARVDEMLELVQLTDYGHRYPEQLSGGQRQRVGFARALAPHPKVLLLDEPFGALDARVRTELRSWLRELHKRTHLTTLLVTHDQAEALELSDRIVVMDKGRVHQAGTPHEIYDHPETPFVASFVGMANVLEAQVEKGRASVGSLAVDVPDNVPEGASVRAIVRPHDVRLRRADAGSHAAHARVRRVSFLGSSVKLDLVLPSDELVTVQIARREFEELKVRTDDRVMVDLEKARVFYEDFAI